jgi:hypothetical protein
MTLQTHLPVGSVFNISRFPAAGMGPGFAAGVTLDAEYLAVALLLSRTASIFTPRFLASRRAFAICLLVNEYA